MVPGQSGSLLSTPRPGERGAEGQVTRCAVLGSPIEHSLSPVLHAAAYRHLGLTEWRYDRFEVTEAGLADFVDALGPEWRGLSLTMPLKSAVMELAETDYVTRLVGVANTLVFQEDGERRVYNTDTTGFAEALRANNLRRIFTATLLGSGATARSALAGLAEMGTREVAIVARTPAKAEPLLELAVGIGVEAWTIPWDEVRTALDLPLVDLVVQTAVARAADPIAELAVRRCRAVFDVIYDPWPTRLAELAAADGLKVVDGLTLLVHQAVLQVELMTGQKVPPQVLMSAGRAAISERRGP